jgi:hypothetical protein
MRNIVLVRVPGPGASTVQVTDEMTVAEFAASESLNGRNIVLDGEGLAPSQWSTTTLEGVREVFATGSVKGN